jgi:AraC-like DNA-binding protein
MAAWLVRRGHVTLKQPGKTLTAKAGEWLVPWPGDRYQEFSEHAEILSVRFQAAWPDGKPLFDRGLSVKFAAAGFPELESSTRQLLALAQKVIPADPLQLSTIPVQFSQFLVIKAALLGWISLLHHALCAIGLQPSRIGIRDERIVGAIQRLDGFMLTEKRIEARLARESGLGPSRFVRLFRESLGETPKQYFDQRRYDYCRQLLAGTSVPIKEIAFNVGFRRISDFSAWFKNRCDKSPRQFRREMGSGREV